MRTTGWVTSGVAIAGLFVLSAQRAPDSPPIKTLHVKGAELAYVEQGRGDPVILIHGALHDYRTWSAQWPELSKRFRVIAYSQRYDHPNPPIADGSQFSVDIFAADLAAFIETLRLAPAHLVGHSRGANIALRVARDHPALVRSVVLGEGSSPAILALSPEFNSLPGDASVQQGREAFRRGDIEGAARIVAENVTGTKGVYDQMPPAQRRMLLDNIPREWGVQSAAPSSARQFTCDEARQIKVPTLLIMGERTIKRNRLMTEEMRKCMPRSEHAVLPAATHALQLENPSGFNTIVLRFLDRQSKSGPRTDQGPGRTKNQGRTHVPGRPHQGPRPKY
jgi:pimeloyl-ACP methyl ester carboxylesterase